MKNKILLFLPFLTTMITVFLLRFVPDEIPTQYDYMGNIDRWGSKYEMLFLPTIIVLIHLIWMIVLRSFKNKQELKNDEKSRIEAIQNEKVIKYVAIGTWLLFTAIHFVIMISSIISVRDDLQTIAFNVWMIISIFMGLFLIVIGNVLPKTKRNSLIGIRTKWSMASDESWSKTNRIGGFILVLIGVLVVIESFLFKEIWSIIVMLILLLVGTVLIVIFSRNTQRSFQHKKD